MWHNENIFHDFFGQTGNHPTYAQVLVKQNQVVAWELYSLPMFCGKVKPVD